MPSFATYFVLSLATVAAAHKRQTLHTCLTSAAVPFVDPSSELYANASLAYNLRFSYEPSAITYPTTLSQVQSAVKCAAKFKKKVQARSGGHSYGAYALGGRDGHLVVDLENFQEVTFNKKTGLAKVGAGVRLGNMALKLWNQGGVGIPHGLCGNVGIGGHALHGGMGLASGMWGHTMDAIVGLKGVTADGKVFEASEKKNSDLFWALKGAGSSFAIVTEFTFKTFAPPPSVTSFQVFFELTDAKLSAQIYLELQDYVLNKAPENLGFQFIVGPGGFGILGSYHGPREEFDAIFLPIYGKIQQMVGKEPAGGFGVSDGTYIQTLSLISEATNNGPLKTPERGQTVFSSFYMKSMLIPRDSPLNVAAVENLFEYAISEGLKYTINSGGLWFIVMNMFGVTNAAFNKIPTAATAFPERDLFAAVEFSVSPPNLNYTGDWKETIIPLADGFYNAIDSKQKPHGRREWPGYSNYLDAEWGREEALQRNYGPNLKKLKKLKRKYDSGNLFWNPQSVGLY